jgi:metal-responsive CopG/Arc/MetJ family transcriptional regulator
MKTAISIPDGLFEQADRLARRVGKTRSGLYSSAVREYLARHAPDEVTAAMDRVCEVVGDYRDPFTATAAQRTLEQTEW